MEYKQIDTSIDTLGEAKIPSPLLADSSAAIERWSVSDNDRIIVNIETKDMEKHLLEGKTPPSFELAGPREKVFFDPSKLKCALVTCGGLCPGLNDIIRAIVFELHHHYGVSKIYGIRYGLQGFIPEFGHDVIDLGTENVSPILDMGGSILGSSRGGQDIDEIIDCLDRMNIGILFMVGGDGTLRAASKICDAIEERGLKISIVGIPKTIDNDIHMVSRSFGFDTAVDVSTKAIMGAHNEARGYPNGIGLIKLMGRHSGFIAATASLAQQDVNFVLIPEVDFDLEGKNGFLTALEKRLKHRGHAVIVAAEGAGQKFFEGENNETDESGNIRLKDIGLFLKHKIERYFSSRNVQISIKYIDPSYMIRSLKANPNDSVFCGFLGRDAVHAGMAGKTNLVIGYWNNRFVHVPLKLSGGKRKSINPKGKLWSAVLAATGQNSLKNER